MDSAEALHRILSNTCGTPEDWPSYEEWVENYPDSKLYSGWLKFEIDLCCMEVVVVARPIEHIEEKGEYDYTQYEIRELAWK